MLESLPGASQIPLQTCARSLAMCWRDALGNTTFAQEERLVARVFEALACAAAIEYERQACRATEAGGVL